MTKQAKTLYIVSKNFAYGDKDAPVRVSRSDEPQELNADAVKVGKKVKAIKEAE